MLILKRGEITIFGCFLFKMYILIYFYYKFIGVDCNANPRHKQVLSNPAPRSRGIPKYLEKYIFYKQAVRNPVYKSQFITMYTAGK